MRTRTETRHVDGPPADGASAEPGELRSVPAAVAARATAAFARLLDPAVELAVTGTSQSVVAARPAELDVVLANLLLNARDALAGEGRGRRRRRGRIEVTTTDLEVDAVLAEKLRLPGPGRHVALAVADTGCGMHPDVVERMFEPGYSTKAPGSGAGLGLALVAVTVHALGGAIAVETAPGAGTQVTVLLPALPGTAPEPVPSQPATRAR